MGIVLQARRAVLARGRGHPVCPAIEFTGRIERRGQTVHAEWPVEIVLQVILTRPHQLHRLPGFLRHEHRLRHVVVREPPPEATARARKLDVDVGTGDPRHGAHEARGSARALERGDEKRALAAQIDERGRRLHGGVREKGLDVGALDDTRGVAPCGFEIAVLPRHPAALIECGDRALLECGGGVGSSGPWRPFDLQRLAAAPCGPEIIRDHCDAGGKIAVDRRGGPGAFDGQHLPYAGDATRLRVIELGQPAVEVGAARDHCGERSRNRRVDPVARGARDDVASVSDRRRAADDVVGALIFERHLFLGWRQLRRAPGEPCVAQRPAIGMQDLSIACAQSIGLLAPLLRRSLQQEPPGPCSDLAQLVPTVTHARAAAGELVTVARNGSPRRTAFHHDVIELLDRHGGPGDIQLLRDQHREGSPHALPDLAAARADHDAPIGLDAHETPERLVDGRRQLHRHRLVGHAALRPDEGHREAARGGDRDVQEFTAR